MKNLFYVLVFGALVSCHQPAVDDTIPSDFGPFKHGVASGDPLHDRVIIWTRVTPENDDSTISVNWELATDRGFSKVVHSGEFETSSKRDYTVKVDVSNLKAGTPYYYRFQSGNYHSPIGRTKTASTNPDSLRFAVVSCANYEWGYFTAYKHIAEKPLLDAVLHLGDYIYEYQPGGYGDTTIGRIHEPPKELLTLSDYRTRYAQYRSDEDLQAAHASHPFITIWDDHEIANDVYSEGAQNHQPDEGDFSARKNAAIQAYYEWLPIREGDKLYRKFDFGSLADVLMLDERLEGRSKPAESIDDPEYNSPDRRMLGEEQLNWLENQLSSDQSHWKLIGNQVFFSDLDQSAVFPNNPKNLDSWNGYPAEKNRLAGFIKSNQISNVIFATGDTHASWALETVVKEVALEPVAVEFGTPSINSANYDEYTNLDTAKLSAKLYLSANPHLRYTNLHDHGYTLLTLNKEKATARYYYVKTVREPGAEEEMAKKVWVESDSPFIREKVEKLQAKEESK